MWKRMKDGDFLKISALLICNWCKIVRYLVFVLAIYPHPVKGLPIIWLINISVTSHACLFCVILFKTFLLDISLCNIMLSIDSHHVYMSSSDLIHLRAENFWDFNQPLCISPTFRSWQPLLPFLLLKLSNFYSSVSI